ncbi:hypothetical protein JOL79_00630 [Microbispora sp. RL4-1S]|uniref:Secreted protein n=1 Tax=Microbispora oryzae TaxID=2806554 RepID=A0A941AN28_9ACTN|nr:hypothetical protein [Microbispora oryzae]MBP2702299.1 hypothetical protein [Microbispora oryzae]
MPAKRVPSMLGLAVVTAFGLMAVQSGQGQSSTPRPRPYTANLSAAVQPMDDVYQAEESEAPESESTESEGTESPGTESPEWSHEDGQSQSQSGGTSQESSAESSSD